MWYPNLYTIMCFSYTLFFPYILLGIAIFSQYVYWAVWSYSIHSRIQAIFILGIYSYLFCVIPIRYLTDPTTVNWPFWDMGTWDFAKVVTEESYTEGNRPLPTKELPPVSKTKEEILRDEHLKTKKIRIALDIVILVRVAYYLIWLRKLLINSK